MQILPAGGNAPLSQHNITVSIANTAGVDISAFRLYQDGKVRGDSDMIFYNQMQSDDGSILLQNTGKECLFILDLTRVKPDVTKISFTLTCDTGKTIASLPPIIATVVAGGTPELQGTVTTAGRSEAALIVCEVYRHKGAWKFRFVSQGFNGGLKALAEHFGVEVADDAAPHSPTIPLSTKPPKPPKSSQPSQSRPINLSKVTLTKEKPRIDLSKQSGKVGTIRINLNWNQTEQQGGIFARNRSIDLDLGAFIRFQNGNTDIIQALGNRFGQLHSSPWVALRDDDRTGSSIDGEWIDVNGEHWDDIAEILIYTFIYEGVSNWQQTDGLATIFVPGHPEVETHLTEGDNRRTLCAIARLINSSGGVSVERINAYYRDQEELDRAYNWGFSWRVGRK